MGPVRIAAAIAVLSLALATSFAQKDTPVTSMDDVLLREQESVEPVDQGTADHRKFESLQREFATGPDVTRACLECHTEAAKQVMETSHWTWICPRAREELADRHGEEPDRIGKGAHVINNFCIALASNEPRCTSCHAGYGWEDKTFDFEDQTLVDCLVCHDQTGEYKKFPTGAGHPNYEPREWPKGSGNIWQPPNLTKIAQNVGKPTRRNCGVCHFWGGGGEGVKHGDMDATLAKPQRSLDVHMAVDGPDFTCTECHTTRDHKIAGRCFTIPAFEERDYVMRGIRGEFDLMVCESCHSAEPHEASVLNGHTDKVSCEACHIPTMAPIRPTKMWWDWSQAGRMNDQGKPYTETSRVGGVEVPSYDTKKGRFIWALDATPEYYWFGGDVEHVFQDDVIDDTTPGRDRGVRKGEHDELDLDQPVISINTLIGSYDDPSSRIYPVKVHRGQQPYDPVGNHIVVPKLFGKPGSGAYWGGWDWSVSIATGMEYMGAEYSGEYDFIQTEMYWPLAHMVRPAEEAVSCEECHSPEGRLQALGGFYMPGRDRSRWLDTLGILAIVGALVGSMGHGGLRIAAAARRRRAERKAKK